MKTSTQKRIARSSGLLLLALLAVALAVPAAQAMRISGTSVPPTSAGSSTSNAQQLPTLAQVRQHQGVGSSTSAGSSTSNAQQLPTLAQVRQHQGVAAAAQPLTLAQIQRIFSRKSRAGSAPSVASVPFAPATGAAPVPSGSSSATVWIAIGSATAAIIIALGAWALIRRRRQSSVPEASAYCELHPGDPLCAG